MNSTQTAGETLTINGVTYNVLQVTTPESAEARGLVNVAAAMRSNGCVRELGLQRPKGRVVYYTNEYVNRYSGGMVYSDVISLGVVR